MVEGDGDGGRVWGWWKGMRMVDGPIGHEGGGRGWGVMEGQREGKWTGMGVINGHRVGGRAWG